MLVSRFALIGSGTALGFGSLRVLFLWIPFSGGSSLKPDLEPFFRCFRSAASDHILFMGHRSSLGSTNLGWKRLRKTCAHLLERSAHQGTDVLAVFLVLPGPQPASFLQFRKKRLAKNCSGDKLALALGKAIAHESAD